MKRKEIYNGIILIFIVIILTGCGSSFSDLQIKVENVENKIHKGERIVKVLKVNIHDLFVGENERTESDVDKIVKAFEENNEKTLIKMYSQKVIESTDEDFSQGCKKFFEMYKGTFKSKEEVTYTSMEHIGPWEFWREVNASYRIITTEGRYILSIQYYQEDTNSEENKGIHYLSLENDIEENEEDRQSEMVSFPKKVKGEEHR